jgi:hypothetical protein
VFRIQQGLQPDAPVPVPVEHRAPGD